ncbi:MAG: type VI secretion system tube protein Hcp [Bryobacterales bacterium]|nr:type VI secretion system tube protein Hcp [Bryobacterales bacterium]
MAANYFLKFTPEIKGESKQKGYEGQIEVLSFSWGVSNAGGFSYAGGGGTAKSNLQDLQISYRQCAASIKIMQYCSGGKHIDKAVLTCLKAAGDKQEKYMTYTLTPVMVSSYQSGGSGDDMPIETMSLNFGKIEFEYFTQDSKGVTTSAGVGKWNQQTATPD